MLRKTPSASRREHTWSNTPLHVAAQIGASAQSWRSSNRGRRRRICAIGREPFFQTYVFMTPEVLTETGRNGAIADWLARHGIAPER